MYVSITPLDGVADGEDDCAWLPPPLWPPLLPPLSQAVWASLHATGVSWTSTWAQAEIVASAAANRTPASVRSAPRPGGFAARAPPGLRLWKYDRMLDLGGAVGEKDNRTGEQGD